MSFRIPPGIEDELNKKEDWSVTRGKRHFHIRIQSRLAGILPYRCNESDWRGVKNIVSQIRRVRKELTV